MTKKTDYEHYRLAGSDALYNHDFTAAELADGWSGAVADYVTNGTLDFLIAAEIACLAGRITRGLKAGRPIGTLQQGQVPGTQAKPEMHYKMKQAIEEAAKQVTNTQPGEGAVS